jgi:hypothetical protein
MGTTGSDSIQIPRRAMVGPLAAFGFVAHRWIDSPHSRDEVVFKISPIE